MQTLSSSSWDFSQAVVSFTALMITRDDTLVCGIDTLESQAKDSANALKLAILELLTAQPGLNDVELADVLREPAFRISELLRELRAKGLIEETE